MKLIAISDIHILSESDPFYGHLLDLISKEIGPKDTLVLGGDIFDFLLGRPHDLQKRFSNFFEALQKAGASGAEIHYVEGNHDFHLKKVFRSIPNCHVHASDFSLTLGGKKFYVAHGDLIDQKDIGYLTLRKVLRSPLVGFTATILPEFALQAIGTKSSDLSQAGRKNRALDRAEARREYTRKIFREFAEDRFQSGYDFVILGHCHDADEWKSSTAERTGHYMNVGYPKEHRNYIRWNEGDQELTRVPLVSD